MNFGETLAHWYFRLNGFFPLSNFVMHYTNTDKLRADCDLLAIRFPHVYEEVGGTEADWDTKFEEWKTPLTNTLGFIVQVKTGKDDSSPGNAFKEPRLRLALERFGIIPKASVAAAANELLRNPVLSIGPNFTIAKLLISRTSSVDENYLHLSLVDVEKFILDRMERYRGRKDGERMFFPSELIQYLAYKRGALHI